MYALHAGVRSRNFPFVKLKLILFRSHYTALVWKRRHNLNNQKAIKFTVEYNFKVFNVLDLYLKMNE